MAVPTHFKFTVRGTLTGTPEQWVTGFHMTRAAPIGGDATLSDIDEGAVTTAVGNFFGSAVFGTQCKVTDWRAYQIGTDGHMQGNAPLLHDYAGAGPTGGSAGIKYPPQIALVVSLLGANKGPAKFGRMYLPAVGYDLDTSWRISDGSAASALSAVTTFLKAVSDAIDMNDTLSAAGCNVSKGPVGSSTGTLQEIDHIEVGRTLDTVRKRRNAMLETYSVGGHIDW